MKDERGERKEERTKLASFLLLLSSSASRIL
jgi:hypothetical protein